MSLQIFKPLRVRESVLQRRSDVLVYVVEDDTNELEQMVSALEGSGYRVVGFANPQLALQTFKDAEPKPDFLLSAYTMYVMNGFELMHHCRSLSPDLRCVLVSGTVGFATVSQFPLKLDGMISKPFSPIELVESLDNLIG